MKAAENVLRTIDLTVRYGGVCANDRVSIDVPSGALVGLIGPNGAGKTSFVNAITGFARCTGRVQFAGRDVTNEPAHRRARLGLARTWQSVELFDDLSVSDNLLVAEQPNGFLPRRRNRRGSTPDISDPLDLLGLTEISDRMPTELSHGKRKLVGVARALAGRPRLICMDEPAAGLDTGESIELGFRLRRLVDDGISILLIDHDMGLVMQVCDYIYVLEFGALLASGAPAEVRTSESVIAAYLGDSP